MDLEYLKKMARVFAYQLRKFYTEDEMPINHYICERNVLVLSTKKLYIYFYEDYIDYIGDDLNNVTLINQDKEKKFLQIKVKEKEFHLVFEKEKDFNAFLNYFDKYRS